MKVLTRAPVQSVHFMLRARGCPWRVLEKHDLHIRANHPGCSFENRLQGGNKGEREGAIQGIKSTGAGQIHGMVLEVKLGVLTDGLDVLLREGEACGIQLIHV